MKKAHLTILTIAFVLNCIGLITLYSATVNASNSGIRNVLSSQIPYTVLAIMITFLIMYLPQRFWNLIAPWSYLITLAGLTWALFSGQQINNASSWIQIAGVSIQPSELLKISLILVLARVLQYQRHDHPFQEIFLVFILCLMPLFLILRQPDLGSALIYIPVILALCHSAGYQLPHLGILASCGSLSLLMVVFGPAWELNFIPLHDYQLSRIIRLLHQDGFYPLTWIASLNPIVLGTITFALIALCYFKIQTKLKWIWILLVIAHVTPLLIWATMDPIERESRTEKILKPYINKQSLEEPQLLQAKYALGNGGLKGQGWLQGNQTQYQRLAYNYSDLIFATFAEEWGFLGVCIVFFLFFALISALILLGQQFDQGFVSLCLYGVAFLFASQIMIHVGYTVGFIPMTGITLPFFSAGGSSLIMTWSSIGMCCALTRNT